MLIFLFWLPIWFNDKGIRALNVRFWQLAGILGLTLRMSALPPKADIRRVGVKNVRFGSKADVLEDGGGLF
jgi:hypothetical protein